MTLPINTYMIGFIYMVEYIGSNDKLTGKRYIGSRKCYGDWESYLGSPISTCDVVSLWRKELNANPTDFKRTILKGVYDADVDLYQEEYSAMKEYGVIIASDSEWINRSYPIVGGMNSPLISAEDKERMEAKRKETLINKYGVEHYSKTDAGRQHAKVTLHTPEIRAKRGKSIKKTYDELSEDVKVQRAQDRAERYKQWYHDPNNQEEVKALLERKRQSLIKHRVVVEDEGGNRITFPICESLEVIGVKSGVVWKRKRGVTDAIMKSKDGKRYKYIE